MKKAAVKKPAPMAKAQMKKGPSVKEKITKILADEIKKKAKTLQSKVKGKVKGKAQKVKAMVKDVDKKIAAKIKSKVDNAGKKFFKNLFSGGGIKGALF
tara:strand:- start:25 stop:321 length:297 start_codon:yes stop_codon:yes gene_type:complete